MSTTTLSPIEQKLRNWKPREDIPQWFSSLRSEAIEAYFDTRPPSRQNEAWHYGTPRRFSLDGMDISHAEPGFNGISYERICGLTGRPSRIACLSMIGDNVETISSSTPLRDAGVTVMSLRQALALRGDQLMEYWKSGLVDMQRDQCMASHFALVDNGFYVHIPKGTEAPEAIHLIMESGEPGSVIAPHIHIVAEENSKADVFIHLLGQNNTARNLQLSVLQSHVAAGATLAVTKIQHLGDATDAMTHEAARIGQGAHYSSIVAHFGGNYSRHEVVANLHEPQGRADLLGVHLGHRKQRFDFHTQQNHEAPETASNLLYKGALMDKSRASYQGIIKVGKKAHRTDAYQTNRTLVLSDHARADSSPQLEIEVDDVRCSHGSSVSNVRRDEMFYMQSRGLDADSARRLIVSGFMAEVADQIPLKSARDYVYNYVMQKVDQ